MKVEDPSIRMKTQKSKTSTFSNNKLPKGCLEDDRWHRIVIPTFIWWVAHQKNPWEISEAEALVALQYIWSAAYGKVIPYMITLDNPVFKNASFFIIFLLLITEQTYF